MDRQLNTNIICLKMYFVVLYNLYTFIKIVCKYKSFNVNVMKVSWLNS